MTSIFLWSYVALWTVVAFLMVALAALSRQIGLLYRRLAPAGARITNAGPEIGQTIAPFAETDIHGRSVRFPASDEYGTLLVFVSPGCQVCDQLIPALKSVAKQERERFNLVLASFNGDALSNRAYAAKHGISNLRFVFSPDLASRLGISQAPYAILIDRTGIVRTKGMVNGREHLDSLLNAAETRHESFEAYAKTQSATLQDEAVYVGAAVVPRQEGTANRG